MLGETHTPAIMIECIDAGIVPYEKALEWQQRLAVKRQKEEIPDSVILLEHPPVFTIGRRDSSSDFLIPTNQLAEKGLAHFKTDRGGRVTYHGPGQLVVYLIFNIRKHGNSVPHFVWKIEECLLRVLAHFHLEGHRDPKHPGIWLENRKIAALGLHIDHGVTTHGFALNVNCNLEPFQYIHPCGITDREVTSLEKELGWQPSLRDVKQTVVRELAAVFKISISVGGSAPSQPE